MLDEIIITVIGGSGGAGIVSFRRERYVPRGGPDGGDGGTGGDVVVVADEGVRVLDDLRRRRTVRAEPGGNGGSAKRHGRDGVDVVVQVPVGTIVWQLDGAEREVADLFRSGMKVVVARGGRRGRGNARLATAVRRAPRITEKGLAGETVRIRLELRLLAEVGLVGLPNAGKSSLLRAASAARPKVGAYPFTTLEPYLGVLEYGNETVVIADIPGLIEGAHEGAGLGIAFLQHVRRTRVLVHVVDGTGPDPAEDIKVVRRELEAFGQGLCEKQWLVALNKADLPEVKEQEQQRVRQLQGLGMEVYGVSARTGEGLGELLKAVVDRARGERKAEIERDPRQYEPPVQAAAARRVQVRRVPQGFVVQGERAAQVVAMLGVESEEARAEVARRLRRIGVAAALRRAGVKPGDQVRIGEVELEWPL